MWPFLLIVGGIAAYVYLRREWRRYQAQKHEAFLERVEAAQEWVNAIDRLPLVTGLRVTLQAKEECYYAGPAEWWEPRTTTRRVSVRGSSVSIPIMKGVRYRVADFTPTYDRETNLTKLATGVLYLTNKRLFFDGVEKNFTVPWSAVSRVAGFEGGFQIEKNSGKPVTIQLTDEPERALAIGTRCHLIALGH